jgi:hypothetical protein
VLSDVLRLLQSQTRTDVIWESEYEVTEVQPCYKCGRSLILGGYKGYKCRVCETLAKNSTHRLGVDGEPKTTPLHLLLVLKLTTVSKRVLSIITKAYQFHFQEKVC